MNASQGFCMDRIQPKGAAMHWMFDLITRALIHWGYWAVLTGLLAESMGFPVPGETVLLFASFLSHKSNHLQLVWIIVIGILAAIAGDNLGFLLGRWWGPSLLRWLANTFNMKQDIAAARDQIQRHGPVTIFWARFVIVFRTIAGPVAGMLGMEWKKFLLFNALGGAAWVTAVALVGYEFANKFHSLMEYFEKVSWILEVAVFTLGWWLWHRQTKKFRADGKRV
jgi:membrane-associated protein